VIVTDEYLAVRVVLGNFGASRRRTCASINPHWRLPQTLHNPRPGRPSRILSLLPEPDGDIVRYVHPEVFQVPVPRPLLDQAAGIAVRYGRTGLLIAETLALRLSCGGHLWFGMSATVGCVVSRGW